MTREFALPHLDLVLRPSLALGGDSPPLTSTLPALVLTHRRVEAYVLQLHSKGLLYLPDLGPQSFSQKGTKHPKEALDANPELRNLYAHLRERPIDAWIFFGAPSACGAALWRALALYVLFWHQIVERGELIGGAESRALAAQKAADKRRSFGPSFIFFPQAVDPLAPHASRHEHASLQARTRRLRLLAGTLTSMSDITHEEIAPVLDFNADAWKSVLKEVRRDLLPSGGPPVPALKHAAKIKTGSFTNLGRVLDALSNNRTGGTPQRHYAIMALHGHWQCIWNSAAVRIYTCPLARSLFHPKIPQASCSSMLPETEAIHSHGGTNKETFIRTSIQLFEEAELFQQHGLDLRPRLLKEAAELGVAGTQDASSRDLIAAIASRFYDAAVSVLKSDARTLDGQFPSSAPEATSNTRLLDRQFSRSSSEDSSEPWTPVAFATR